MRGREFGGFTVILFLVNSTYTKSITHFGPNSDEDLGLVLQGYISTPPGYNYTLLYKLLCGLYLLTHLLATVFALALAQV